MDAFKAISLNSEIIDLLLHEADSQLEETRQKKKEEHINKILKFSPPPVSKSINKIGALLIGLSLIKKYDSNAKVYVEMGRIWCGDMIYCLMDEKEKELMLRNEWTIDHSNEGRWLFITNDSLDF